MKRKVAIVLIIALLITVLPFWKTDVNAATYPFGDMDVFDLPLGTIAQCQKWVPNHGEKKGIIYRFKTKEAGLYSIVARCLDESFEQPDLSMGLFDSDYVYILCDEFYGPARLGMSREGLCYEILLEANKTYYIWICADDYDWDAGWMVGVDKGTGVKLYDKLDSYYSVGYSHFSATKLDMSKIDGKKVDCKEPYSRADGTRYYYYKIKTNGNPGSKYHISFDNSVKDYKICTWHSHGVQYVPYHNGKSIQYEINLDLERTDIMALENNSYKMRETIDYFFIYLEFENQEGGSFTITEEVDTNPPSMPNVTDVKAGKNRLTVKWEGTTGPRSKYQIAFKKKTAKKWTVMNLDTNLTEKTLYKLQSNTEYTVMLRAVKIVNGVSYFGKWTKSKTVRVK